MKNDRPAQSFIPTGASLVGMYFHTLDEGMFQERGCIVGNPLPGWYQAEVYYQSLGEPRPRNPLIRLWQIQDIDDWYFFLSEEAMEASAHHHQASL